MSLRDEFPSGSNDAASYSRIKYKEHSEIEQQTSEFIAKGGGVREIPIGVSANAEALPVLRNEYSGEMSMRETMDRMNGQQRAVAKQRKKMKTDKPTNDFGDW